MSTPENTPTHEGEQKIMRWVTARQRVKSVKEQLNTAECEMMNATNDLGRWLTPKDAQLNERFSIWYSGALIQVECVNFSGNGAFTITVRERDEHAIEIGL